MKQQINADRINLSIDEMATALGDLSTEADIYVYAKSDPIKRVPVDFPFRLDHFSILLITSGSCEYQTNFVYEQKTVNDLLFFPPQLLTQVLSISKDFQAQMVSFTAAFHIKLAMNFQHVETFNFFLSEQSKTITLSVDEAQVVAATVSQLALKRERKDNPYKNELINLAFSMLMFEIMSVVKYRFNFTRNHLSRKEDYMLRFMRLVSIYVTKERSIRFYADQLGITPGYLTKMAKMALQKSAATVIEDAVIQEAKILLHRSALSIAQIAEKLCFSDQFQFSKYFKKKTKFTPSAYRKIEISWLNK